MNDCKKRTVELVAIRSCKTCTSFKPYSQAENSWGECEWFAINKLQALPGWVKVAKTYGSIRGSDKWRCPAHSENVPGNPGRYWDDERRADELYLDRPTEDEEEDDDAE
jgi:hypothetical protein